MGSSCTASMPLEQKHKYIRELREWIAYVRKEWGYRKVPAHLRVAVMSHAGRAATGPHFTGEY
jgi:hypothetical protein